MTVYRPCYCTRETLMKALDIKFTARMADAVDRAIETASENIDGHMLLQFYPEDKTIFINWPNFDYSDPWRIWLKRNTVADITVNPPVVKSGGNVIPANTILWGPWDNPAPPFRFLELDRSASLSNTFGQGVTDQKDVSITATFGFWRQTNSAGTLAASINNVVTALTVSDGSKAGVGDVLIIGTERMLVQDKAMVTTAQTQQGAGVSTAQKSDVALTVTDGTKYFMGEVLLLDSERMLIVDIAGNILTVRRAWDGTVLATHSNATIFALRALTVTRGDLGTTAAAHTQNDPCTTSRVPPLIRDLALAEAAVQGEQELGAYAGTQGEGGGASISALGEGLADKWDEATVRYGRQMRIEAI